MQHLSNPIDARKARPTLYLTVGLPGAGKTTKAVQLETRHNALRLSLDAWMLPIFDGINEERSRDLLEGLIISLALQALQLGTSVVLDFGLWTRSERSALRALATTVGANSEVVYMAVDRETQIQRVTNRYETTPNQTFAMTQEDLDRWRLYFEIPDRNELTGLVADEPPTGFETWSAWASNRWPSFGAGSDALSARSPNGRGVRICTDEWQAKLAGADDDADFHERLQTHLHLCALDLLRHGLDVILEDGLCTRAEN